MKLLSFGLFVIAACRGVCGAFEAQGYSAYGCMAETFVQSVQGLWTAHCNMDVSYAARKCCNGGYWGFATGGVWRNSPMQTHHNEAMCLRSRPNGDYERLDSCNQPCPGSSYYKGREGEGMCGGGCQNCPKFPKYEAECIADDNIKCGELWSVYDCAQSEPKMLADGSASVSGGDGTGSTANTAAPPTPPPATTTVPNAESVRPYYARGAPSEAAGSSAAVTLSGLCVFLVFLMF